MKPMFLTRLFLHYTFFHPLYGRKDSSILLNNNCILFVLHFLSIILLKHVIIKRWKQATCRLPLLHLSTENEPEQSYFQQMLQNIFPSSFMTWYSNHPKISFQGGLNLLFKLSTLLQFFFFSLCLFAWRGLKIFEKSLYKFAWSS